jgi:hypothetical protein
VSGTAATALLAEKCTSDFVTIPRGGPQATPATTYGKDCTVLFRPRQILKTTKPCSVFSAVEEVSILSRSSVVIYGEDIRFKPPKTYKIETTSECGWIKGTVS